MAVTFSAAAADEVADGVAQGNFPALGAAIFAGVSG